MATSPYVAYAKRVCQTPQSEPIDATQVKNNAGGFVYALDPWAAMLRFLILGTEGGTYYAGEIKHTQQAARNTIKCIEEDGKKAVDLIVGISDAGRAAKNDPALFALALASATPDPATRAYALAALPKVARIPTHLFHFLAYVSGMRGWGRGLRAAIGNWYSMRPADNIAYQAVKYQSRDGWANKDAIILGHPKSPSLGHAALFNWLIKGKEGITEATPSIILAFHEVQATTNSKRVAELIRSHNLSREMLPTIMLNEKVVWEALLEKMPMTALIRNLGNLTKLGLVGPLSDETRKIANQLVDPIALTKARVHPLNILNAMKTYASGHGLKGKGEWTPVQKIVDALDRAFYLSFGNVEPTGKNLMLALDVSGSMVGPNIAGTSITPREACAALALITANVEPKYVITGFTSGGVPGSKGYASGGGYRGNAITQLAISPEQRLDDVVKYTAGLDFGGTDCALPMLLATAEKWKVDAFAIYTDSETWAGNVHPMQALKEYRNKSGIGNAKLIVNGMTATNFSIADPKDPLCLDVVGFDMNAPSMMSEFIRG